MIQQIEFWAFLIYHATLAMLIGLAFRRTSDLVTAWRFAGLVTVSWLMTVGALLFIRNTGVNRIATPDSGMFLLQSFIWLQMLARPVCAALYALLLWLRDGWAGWKSFACALGTSCVVIVSWIVVREMLWPEVEFEQETMREAFWLNLTSWDVTLNWIVWYWFLFRQNPPKTADLQPS